MMQKRETLFAALSAGVTPAMATPLTGDGFQVNRAVIPQLVNFLISAGVRGLFIGGTTGEGILLSATQRRLLHEEVLTAASGRVPVLVHVGAIESATATILAAHAQEIGADGRVAVAPYYYPIHEAARLDYFRTVAAAAPDTPFFAYDIPHMAVNGVSPAMLHQIGATIPNFAGVKTSNHDAQVIRALIDAAPAGTLILAGNERIALGSLALGAHGLISGLSTAVPEPFVALTQAVAAGNLETARNIHQQINRLLDLIPAGARLGAIKQVLAERGIAVGDPVPPRPGPGADPLWPRMAAVLANGPQTVDRGQQ